MPRTVVATIGRLSLLRDTEEAFKTALLDFSTGLLEVFAAVRDIGRNKRASLPRQHVSGRHGR